MFTHLLIPIDGSERSQRAIDVGIGLASKLGASVTAFIAEPPAPGPAGGYSASAYVHRLEEHGRDTAAHAQSLLDAVKTQAQGAGVTFNGCFSHTGQVVPAILETARERCCDLIVMATHVHGLFTDWLTPSTTKGVMARSELPLLVVH